MAKLRSIGRVAARKVGGPGARGALALVLAVALTLTSTAPAWAVMVEIEAEGEGSSPPGTLPGLEAGPELEGEETALSEEAPLAGEEGEEEAAAVPVEPEAPEAAPAAPVPAPTEEPWPEAPVAPEAAPPPVVEPTAPPAYEAEAPPTYETEATAPAVVHGETIVAPAEPRRSDRRGPVAPTRGAPDTAPVVGAPPPAAPPAGDPEPEQAPPAMPRAEAAEAPGSLRGNRLHTVRPGESLWSIATALLPAGADDARIAAEVHRLWRANAERISTGDPDLIYVGTRLRLA